MSDSGWEVIEFFLKLIFITKEENELACLLFFWMWKVYLGPGYFDFWTIKIIAENTFFLWFNNILCFYWIGIPGDGEHFSFFWTLGGQSCKSLFLMHKPLYLEEKINSVWSYTL